MKVNLKQMKVNVVKKTYYNIMVDIPEILTMKEFMDLQVEVLSDAGLGINDDEWEQCDCPEYEIIDIDYIEEAK